MPVCPGGPDRRPCGPGGGAPGNRKGDRKRWGGWRPTPQGAALRVGVGTHTGTLTRARPHTCSHRPSRTACGLRAPSAGSCWCWLPPSSALRGPVTRWACGLAQQALLGQDTATLTTHPAGWGRGPRTPPEPGGNTEVGGPRGARVWCRGGPYPGVLGVPSSSWLYQALFSCRCSEGRCS